MSDAIPVADAHSDLLLELVYFRGEESPFAQRWLPSLTAGAVQLQVCALWSDDEDLPDAALRRALQGVVAFDRAVADNAQVVAVRSASDLATALEPGRLGLLLSLEGVEPLGYDPSLIDVFCSLGVRMASLTWNRRNAFADGTGEGPAGGLSRIGRQLVDRMLGLPIALDLAHAGVRTFFEVLERSEDRPVLVSHALCHALHGVPRNLTDAQLRALAERDGVVGLMPLPLVVHPSEWTIARVIDHVDHLAQTIGLRHICLGADFIRQIELSGAMRDPVPLAGEIEGLTGPEDYPRLLAALSDRGYSDADVRAIASENLVRVLRRALPA
jgi:membrane dipeptidase